MDHEQHEIMRHAVIGGLVAVALASFHEVAEKVAKEWLDGHAVLTSVVEWSSLFLVVFVAILVIEGYLRRRQWKARIRLDGVGYVDGRWICVRVRDGEVTGATVLEISSAAGEGFRISGSAHSVGPGGLVPAPIGHFQTTHGTLFAKNGIAYVFEGHTPQGKEHFGVGYHRFQQQGTSKTVGLEGAYLARQENKITHTFGARLNEGALNALTDDEVLAIVRAFLERPETRAFAASHPSAQSTNGG
jgi:hypothetical protein